MADASFATIRQLIFIAKINVIIFTGKIIIIIVPVPKKGNPNDVNNYRGISLTSIFSKIFSSKLNKRLSTWANDNDLLNNFQYGFRKNRSTIDCIFVLNCIIDKVVNNEKGKLYCCSVDFKKAFDLVYRNGIWMIDPRTFLKAREGGFHFFI